jgi:hypothetical protein
MAEGGYPEAVIRMMILLAQARGGVRRDRLVRSSAMMRETEPVRFHDSGGAAGPHPHPDGDLRMSPTEALETLPTLLPKAADRRRALASVEGVAGRGSGHGRGGPGHAPAHPDDPRRRRQRPARSRCPSTRRRSRRTEGGG